MKYKPFSILITALVLSLSLSLPATIRAHEGETSIIPASLVIKAGKSVDVTVEGFADTDTATFTIKGMFGDNDLGTYTVKDDDFNQTLNIPANLEPGSYSLIVTGGDKSAKVIVTVK